MGEPPEDLVRRALAEEAGQVEPSGDGLARIGDRIAGPPPAGFRGEEFRRKVRAAQAAVAAAARRNRKPAPRRYQPGMARKPPPPGGEPPRLAGRAGMPRR